MQEFELCRRQWCFQIHEIMQTTVAFERHELMPTHDRFTDHFPLVSTYLGIHKVQLILNKSLEHLLCCKHNERRTPHGKRCMQAVRKVYTREENQDVAPLSMLDLCVSTAASLLLL